MRITRTNLLHNRRKATITAKALDEYQELIQNTVSDLEDNLQRINDKLQTLVAGSSSSCETNLDQQEIQLERDSIQRCLDICAEMSSHIEKGQSTVSQSMLTFAEEYGSRIDINSSVNSAQRATITVLDDCKERLTYTSSQLRVHLMDVLRRLDAFQGQTFVHPDSNEQNKLREEINSIKRSLAVCAKASEDASTERVDMFDEVPPREDSLQVIVPTVRNLMNSRRVSADSRSQLQSKTIIHDPVLSLSLPLLVDKILRKLNFPVLVPVVGEGRTRVYWTSVCYNVLFLERHTDIYTRVASACSMTMLS